MSYKEHKAAAPHSVNCAVLTFSDSRTEAEDDSGNFIKQKLAEAGHTVGFYTIMKDDRESIKDTVEDLLGEPDIQVIITNGGTGITHRDVAVETISGLMDRKLDGFGELFRWLSYQEIGASAIMSRAVAGTAAGKVIICLPGSLGAVTTALEKIILPEIGHMVREVSR